MGIIEDGEVFVKNYGFILPKKDLENFKFLVKTDELTARGAMRQESEAVYACVWQARHIRHRTR